MPETWRGKPAIWLAWTGSNPLPDLLAACLESIRRHNGADFEIIVVTPENVRQYGDPHPAYEYLSLVHRADYLRLWLLHHYGGIYLDMDTVGLRSLRSIYENLRDYDLVTYDGAPWGEVFGTSVIGPTRRDSVLTRAWNDALDTVLDRRHDDLAAFRRSNTDPFVDCLGWNELLSGLVTPVARRIAAMGQLSVRLLEPTWAHFASGGPAFEELFRPGMPPVPDTELLILNHALLPDSIKHMTRSEIRESDLGICRLLQHALGWVAHDMPEAATNSRLPKAHERHAAGDVAVPPATNEPWKVAVPGDRGDRRVRYPATMEDLFEAPAYLVNLKRRPDRLQAAFGAIQDAGYRRIIRFAAVDGQDPEALARAWAAIGNPRFSDEPRHRDFHLVGHQGCFLSHVLLWEWIAQGDAPFATIFEDDVLFHPGWRWLAPEYLRRTPADWDIVHLGHHAFRDMGTHWAARVPVQSTVAYMVTREGAAAMSRAIRSQEAVGVIDQMIPALQARELDGGASAGFRWYAWNGWLHPMREWAGLTTPSGLVFQRDAAFGSDTRVR